MSKGKNNQPTASELAVLQLLWERGGLPVKAVHEELSKEREVVYTTVLKTLQVMLERGFVSRESQGRKHIYHAAIAREETQNSLLDTFIDRAFGGSAKELAMRALGNYKTTQSDIDDLKALIDDLEKNKK